MHKTCDFKVKMYCRIKIRAFIFEYLLLHTLFTQAIDTTRIIKYTFQQWFSQCLQSILYARYQNRNPFSILVFLQRHDKES